MGRRPELTGVQKKKKTEKQEEEGEERKRVRRSGWEAGKEKRKGG